VFAIELVVFSAAGWLVSGILDLMGVLSLTNALFLTAVGVGIVAGLLILESSGVSVSSRMRMMTSLALVDSDAATAVPGTPVTQMQALAIVAGVVSAAGLAAAAVLVG